MELLNDILCDAAPEDTIQSGALADFEHALALEICVCLQEAVESFGVFESSVNYRSFLCTRISLGDWFVVSILRRALVCVCVKSWVVCRGQHCRKRADVLSSEWASTPDAGESCVSVSGEGKIGFSPSPPV